MQVTENEVLQGIKAMESVWTTEPTPNVKAIAAQLEREMDAGEFDGSKDSAILCLELAGFDVLLEKDEAV